MRYLKKYNEDMSLAKSIIGKKMEAFDKLKDLLSKNLGYIGRFTEYLMNEHIPYEDLEKLYKSLLSLKNQNQNINITSLKYEEAIDKIQEVRNDISIKSFINQFPSEQKAFVKSLLSANGQKNTATNNYNLVLKASKKDKLDVFISKISRYKSIGELKNALGIFGKDSFNDREEVKKWVGESGNSNIVYENEDILVVKVNTIDDIKKLGSDTSWCILGASMWERYTKGRFQYILYDYTLDEYNPLFKIGFTLNKDLNIHAAHDILDSGATAELKEIVKKYDGFEFANIVPVVDVVDSNIDLNIDNIKNRTSITNLSAIAEALPLDKLPEFIIKLLDLNKVSFSSWCIN